MAEVGSVRYVNSATNRASHLQAVWVKNITITIKEQLF